LDSLTPEELIDAPFNLAPIGSGPYRLDQLMSESGQVKGIALVANEDHHRGRPFIDEINFFYYTDDRAALTAYQTGEVQGIAQVTPQTFGESGLEADLNLYTGRLPRMAMIFLNLDNPAVPFLRETEIRYALMTALNRQRLIDRVLDGQAIIADGPILPNTWAHFDTINRIPYNPEEALKLIKEAGYTVPIEGGPRANEEGVALAFTLVHPDTEEHAALAALIAENWSGLGIDLTLEAVPYDELISEYLDTRLYDAALVDISLSRTPDPDPYPFWHQTQATNGQNYSMWNDRQASEYLEQARIIVDPAERGRLYRNFQVRFSIELPSLPLYYPMYTYAVNQQVQGVRMGPLFDTSDRFATLQTWYFYSEIGTEPDQTQTPAP
jgi:peptide/nickel transport system substrate-binding protein